MITIEVSRLGIDPRTSNPWGKHANHDTNGDRQFQMGLGQWPPLNMKMKPVHGSQWKCNVTLLLECSDSLLDIVLVVQ